VAEELTKPLLNFRTADFFEKNMVNAHIGVKVAEISPDKKTVKTEDGKVFEYDKLLLATGGRPIIPPIPGKEKEGISTLKYMADAEKVLNMQGKKAVVIGAGSIGLETCISLKRRGMEVSLIEQLGQVMPTVFDEESASIIRKVIEEKGIDVYTGERAVEFLGDGSVKGVRTPMRELACDMVVLAVGIRPAIELAKGAGVTIGDRGGIKTDDLMLTNAPNVYAAGDVAETFDIARNTNYINAIWPCAVEQGRVAGLNMAGKKVRYPGSVRMNSIGNFIGFPAISMGVTHASECSYLEPDCNYQEIKRRTMHIYRKLILKDWKIVGAIMVGKTQKAGLVCTLLRKQIPVEGFISNLMSDSLNFADLLPLIRRHAQKFSELEFKELMDSAVLVA
jgi:nitrite reductase (NADH) large subunit